MQPLRHRLLPADRLKVISAGRTSTIADAIAEHERLPDHPAAAFLAGYSPSVTAKQTTDGFHFYMNVPGLTWSELKVQVGSFILHCVKLQHWIAMMRLPHCIAQSLNCDNAQSHSCCHG